ncbi:FAD-dependent oxidoreductase [Streptomyces sp. NPDC050428]|uniref:NAD(P)/FAD-dependent oxidoreductase n=1 Tax=Streptomyces sp. NPDC050428 TaxID=3155757 RepID=UPI003433361B
MSETVIVVGGGVVGLTSAVVLAERGRRVRVWSRDAAERTTSAVAGALFWPYRIEPAERVGPWSLRSLREYVALARDPEATGVRVVAGLMTGTAPAGLGSWVRELPELREARPGELPAGCGQALRGRVPLIDMPAHLRYLEGRLHAAGGSVEPRTVGALEEAAAEAPVVVNCSGLGARELVPDVSVFPVRGQLVVVENPGIEEWLVSKGGDGGGGAAGLAYLFPQPFGLVLGGTAEDHSWDLRPDPATAAAIVERCAVLRPELRGARVLAHRVGLRPARARVRVEAGQLPGGARLVHNYGHGGAGVTVAWGCAEEAARLAG